MRCARLPDNRGLQSTHDWLFESRAEELRAGRSRHPGDWEGCPSALRILDVGVSLLRRAIMLPLTGVHVLPDITKCSSCS